MGYSMLSNNSISGGKTKRRSGFTLIEALVVVAIIAVTSAIVIPGMSGFVYDSRVSGNVNEFIGAMTLARTEAVKRGRLVTICRSADADNATPTCADGSDWATGWIVFQEGSSSSDVGSFGSGDVLLQRRGALISGMIAQSSPAISGVTFNSLGEQIGSTTAVMGFDFSVNNKSARKVCINRNGRVKVIQKPTGSTTC